MRQEMNPKTGKGKGWTDAEETLFREIMRIGRMERIPAIHLYRRCRSNPDKALRCAREWYRLTEAQEAAYEQTKAKRLAALSKANQNRARNSLFQRQKLAYSHRTGQCGI